MASNYPAGAEHDPNAPYNQVDYPLLSHEVELSITFRLYAPSLGDAEDDVEKIDKKLTEFLKKLKGVEPGDVCVEVMQVNADYYDDYYDDYFHGED